MKTTTSSYAYQFEFDNGKKIEHKILLDQDNILVQDNPRKEEKNDASNSTVSPASISLIPLIEKFDGINEQDNAKITLITENRTYSKETTCMTGLRSLVGLIMVTSGCPSLSRFRPLIDSHLPFMSISESTYRILSTYLLAQYFREANGKKADWTLEHIDDVMMEISATNKSVCAYLKTISSENVVIKAVETLDALSGFAGLSQNTSWMTRLEKLFIEDSNWGKD